MRVLVFWEPLGLTSEQVNPYAGLLAQALEPLGVETVAGFRDNLNPHWIRENAPRFDVIHLHWPWVLYYADTVEDTMRCAAEMMDALALARSMGVRIVWTMHNLYPHDTSTPHLDRLVRLGIVGSASAVIVHCDHARGLLARTFHREADVFTIPHGHFADPYPNTLSVADARRHFGFEDRHFVFLLFGTVRRNKGFEQCLESFHALEGEHLRLLFGARVVSEYSSVVVEQARQLDSRMVLYETERFEPDEFQLFYNAVDIAVFPFTEILTSGSAITSLSFYCPVIVPALGCLPELVDDSVGKLYDPQRPGALREAMAAAPGMRRDALRPGIEKKLAALNWKDIARRTLEAYRH